jgi:hypothetical protein
MEVQVRLVKVMMGVTAGLDLLLLLAVAAVPVPLAVLLAALHRGAAVLAFLLVLAVHQLFMPAVAVAPQMQMEALLAAEVTVAVAPAESQERQIPAVAVAVGMEPPRQVPMAVQVGQAS